MVSRILFTIHVDINEDRLDNPGWWREDGTQAETDKSKRTKEALNEWAGRIIKNQSEYALGCSATYVVRTKDDDYKKFYNTFRENHPQISDYDIINFYKHHLMKVYAEAGYDEICYFDLDVIVNTDENIFEAHDIHNKFACAESNAETLHGRGLMPHEYNLCIRNPASKYWNAYALLLDSGRSRSEADTDVFNTGIMIASADQVRKLGYFENLSDIIEDMEYLKSDTSVFHENVVRSFNYDNETIFAYKRVVNNVDIDYINESWHQRVIDGELWDVDSKVFHVISKRFEELEHILCRS